MRKTELPNCPEWLNRAITEHEDVVWENDRVTWLSGNFRGGNFLDGSFRGGNFRGGNFRGGNFRGGNFLDGNFLGGNFLDGSFWGGSFWGGNFRGGNFRGGNFRGGNFLGGRVNGVDEAKPVITFCNCDGWPKTLVNVNGVAWVLAGCRWFCFDDARKHWAGREDRIMTRAFLHGAYRLIRHLGLRTK